MWCCLGGFDLTRFLITSAARAAQYSGSAHGEDPSLGPKAGCGISCNERAEHETEFESPDHGH